MTRQEAIFGDARDLAPVAAESVDLVVTSPPYPLVEMWDSTFARLSPDAAAALARGDGEAAFEACHRELDRAWAECARALRPGGFVCVNVGDATRTLGGRFRLYPNHARVLAAMGRLGLTTLPDILWRKPTNAPTKFMGSGMLPAGAYVTYEHEYILVFRKGEPRAFETSAEKMRRRRSAFFWEERNVWFSDVWTDLPGARQLLGETRSGAFPFELAYRLVNMFSVAGDTVLDPFLGTGTTLAAAAAAGRNGIGVEIDRGLAGAIEAAIRAGPALGHERAAARLEAHRAFVTRRLAAGAPLRHWNEPHRTPVMTAQERDLVLPWLLQAEELPPLALHR